MNVDPASGDSNEVSVVSDALPTMKLRVTTSSKELKAADVAKQRQDVEAEAKDAAQGYLVPSLKRSTQPDDIIIVYYITLYYIILCYTILYLIHSTMTLMFMCFMRIEGCANS